MHMNSRFLESANVDERTTGGLVSEGGAAAKGVAKVSAGPSQVVWQHCDVSKKARASRLDQTPVIVWFTGLPGSGKSTCASALEHALFSRGHNTYLLDGDNVRCGLCSDLGFDFADRQENIRRVGEVAALMLDAGLIVIVSLISPFLKERSMVRAMVEPGEFIEVFVNTSLVVCEQRDPKGLYEQARKGAIHNFTGVSSPYEAPTQHEIEIDTEALDVTEVTQKLLSQLKRYGIVT